MRPNQKTLPKRILAWSCKVERIKSWEIQDCRSQSGWTSSITNLQVASKLCIWTKMKTHKTQIATWAGKRVPNWPKQVSLRRNVHPQLRRFANQFCNETGTNLLRDCGRNERQQNQKIAIKKDSGKQSDTEKKEQFRREQDCYSKDNGSLTRTEHSQTLNIFLSSEKNVSPRSNALGLCWWCQWNWKHPNTQTKRCQKIATVSNFGKAKTKYTTQLQPTHRNSEHLTLKRTCLQHPETLHGGTSDQEMEAQATPRPLSMHQFVAVE